MAVHIDQILKTILFVITSYPFHRSFLLGKEIRYQSLCIPSRFGFSHFDYRVGRQYGIDSGGFPVEIDRSRPARFPLNHPQFPIDFYSKGSPWLPAKIGKFNIGGEQGLPNGGAGSPKQLDGPIVDLNLTESESLGTHSHKSYPQKCHPIGAGNIPAQPLNFPHLIGTAHRYPFP